MAGLFDESTENFGIPGLDDWYDKALASGQGFKSEEERQAYIKSLGDPEKHPMFATTTEDLEGNPLTEALRALREEDKTPVEIATMYKDEGNEWMKKGDSKSLHEAYNRYTHALNILEGNAVAATSGVTSDEQNAERKEFLADLQAKAKVSSTESTIDTEEDIRQLKSLLFSNRAMASLSLKNYGSCKKDADAAIALWSGNIKAHYRKCKALLTLRKYDEALTSCQVALVIDPINVQILAIQEKCTTELEKVQIQLENKQKEIKARHAIEEARWITAWEIITGVIDENGKRRDDTNALKSSGEWGKNHHTRKDGGKVITVGFAADNQQPVQLKEILPHLSEENLPVWPMLMLYPQYSQLDVVQGVCSQDRIVAHLAEMFPELEDLKGQNVQGYTKKQQNPIVPWDRDGEYTASHLVVYAPLESAPRIATIEEWLLACREQQMIRQGSGGNSSSSGNGSSIHEDELTHEKALKQARIRSKQHETKLFRFYDNLNDLQKDEQKTTQGQGLDASTKLERVGYLEVHVGCKILDVLQSPHHVLSGGLLTFLVFVKGNLAHKKFLADVVKNRHGVWLLQPDGKGQSGERLV